MQLKSKETVTLDDQWEEGRNLLTQEPDGSRN